MSEPSAVKHNALNGAHHGFNGMEPRTGDELSNSLTGFVGRWTLGEVVSMLLSCCGLGGGESFCGHGKRGQGLAVDRMMRLGERSASSEQQAQNEPL